jgi:hypothetical protein
MFRMSGALQSCARVLWGMRAFLVAGLLSYFLSIAPAQTIAPEASQDSDHDGLSDAVEDALLAQFAPHFLVSDDDCSLRPAQFVPFVPKPEVQQENGTIYGEAFLVADSPGRVELHYYHLWRRDCGEFSHHLDAEHVSALVARDDSSNAKALYWYAAAHENTLCDASQIARAVTVDGELHGPKVWISRGKHASFLSDAICAHGCGGDRCIAMQALANGGLINLGERSSAMNGATWAESPQWPLSAKMSRSDFSADRTARADRLPGSSIAWANPERKPVKAAILGSNHALGGTEAGLHSADTALDQAGSSTGNALDSASTAAGNGLAKSAHGVKRALRATARKLGMTKPQ